MRNAALDIGCVGLATGRVTLTMKIAEDDLTSVEVILMAVATPPHRGNVVSDACQMLAAVPSVTRGDEVRASRLANAPRR